MTKATWPSSTADRGYRHRVDPPVPIEDVTGAVKDLITLGKVLPAAISGVDDGDSFVGSICR